ncbi:nucleotide exchange factor GrpE [Candidatus Falkowbacteria bacterium]|nr:nucleotide exchange factor GrpE [Candidatus Falkowbacteria bacterium]
MNEEKKTDSCNKYAIVGVSAFIFNNKGELLLTRSPKWNNSWVVPGGKVEFGESMEKTLKREMKEELNLDISGMEYLTTVELNRTKERPDLHMVVNEFVARADNQEVIINDEHSSYEWRKPEDWLKEKDLYRGIREIIEYYLNEFKNKSEWEDKYKRALADYQNLLKQTAKEKMEFAVYANERMLKEILPVYDHLKMAMEHPARLASEALRARHNGESTDEWLTGVEHVVKQFKDVLARVGVEEIKINNLPTGQAGNKFDHNLMEAISSEETEDESLDGLVAREVKAGYKLNGKVIEPVKVVVYKLK